MEERKGKNPKKQKTPKRPQTKTSQVTKVASEVPAGPGTDTCSVQHRSESDLLSKGRGVLGRGLAGEEKALPSPLQFWVGL